MKILVFAEHLLSPDKISEFDAVFETHLAEVSQFPGFVSLRKLIEQDDNDTKPCILLEFSDQDLLLTWRESDAHQSIAKAYAACWANPPRVRVFKIEK